MTEGVVQPALVLGHTPHGDRAKVLRLWLREVGLWTAYVPNVRRAEGGVRPAMVMPLASLEVVPARGRGRMGRLVEARLEPVWRRLHDEPMAQMVVLYAAESLRRVLHEGNANPAFFDAARAMLASWDRSETHLNRGPLDWTLLLCRHLGFELEAPEGASLLFYPAEATWAPLGNVDSWASSPLASEALAAALRGEDLNRTARNEALDAVLAYLEAQHPGWGRINSLEVLRSL